MILYLNDSKKSTQKLLDTIKSFSNVAECKINLQKSVAFLSTNNEQIEKKYRKIIAFAIIPQNQIPRNKFKKGCK
jgi:ABC-type polysaccharide/polyol phosphate transport system ATPase subunit